ncbi:MAG: hypothetical protein LBG29_00075 [Synergistaceae bacterium]|jgi:hypothetical protein|nr:hypothetical protein [Synergistaceae bacterium]
MAEAVAKKSTAIPSKSSAAATRTRAAKQSKRGQIAILLFLLMCFVASLYVFKMTMDSAAISSNLPEPRPSEPSDAIVKESAEVEKLGSDFSGMTMSTTLAMQTAGMAEQIGRLPVASPATLSPPPPPPAFQEEAYEPDPPVIRVKAVMITEGDSMAIIDVEGEESGLLVRRGSKFSNGDARITKIDSKGVTFTWMRKSYPVAVER